MTVLDRIRSHGFTVTLLSSGDSFEVTPASLLLDTQRTFLKTHKAEIIQQLKQEYADQEHANDDTLIYPITQCRHCSQFHCFNAHGGGAGYCRLGITFGACALWSDTPRRCAGFVMRS